jgi:cell wall-associated NlpC family hydrolase
VETACSRNDIVEAARKYVGSPIMMYGRGPAFDCVGLIVVVAQDLGLNVKDLGFYRPAQDGKKFNQYISQQMAPGEYGPGIVALMSRSAKPDRPKHAGILTDGGVVHANITVGYVTEHVVNERVRNTMVSFWEFPGVNYG